MARTTLTPVSAPGSKPLTAQTLTWTAADVANGNQFTWTGKEQLWVFNSDTNPHNVKFQTVAIAGRQDPKHNTNQAIAAGAYQVWGEFDGQGIKQTDGKVYVNADDATVKFAVVRHSS